MDEKTEQEVGTPVVEETPPPEPEPKQEYDLHIKVPAEMRQKLKDCAELAYKMGDTPKPDLVDLMNLFITWGMTVMHKKWLDRIGYK